MSTELTPAEELAFPFVQSACRLSEMKENGSDHAALLEAVNRNAALWMYFEREIVPTTLELKKEARELMERMSRFMLNSSIVLERNFSMDLIDRIIDINLQLSEEILSAPVTLH